MDFIPTTNNLLNDLELWNRYYHARSQPVYNVGEN